MLGLKACTAQYCVCSPFPSQVWFFLYVWYSCVVVCLCLYRRQKESIGYPSLSLYLFFHGRISAEVGASFVSSRLEAASSNNPPISSSFGAGVKACRMGAGTWALVFVIVEQVLLSVSHFPDPDFIYWFIDIYLFVCMYVCLCGTQEPRCTCRGQRTTLLGVSSFFYHWGFRDQTQIIITSTFTS